MRSPGSGLMTRWANGDHARILSDGGTGSYASGRPEPSDLAPSSYGKKWYRVCRVGQAVDALRAEEWELVRFRADEHDDAIRVGEAGGSLPGARTVKAGAHRVA